MVAPLFKRALSNSALSNGARLEHALEQWKRQLQRGGLMLSVSKTQYMVCNDPISAHDPLIIDGQQVTKWVRPRGRPKTRLTDVVRKDLQSCNVSEEDTSDRAKWRRKTRKADPTIRWE
ncbi:hypothetical protein ACJJTC_018730 [Scirpophaga incertulas]